MPIIQTVAPTVAMSGDLKRKISLVGASLSLAAALMGSSLPSPLYPVYQQAWDLSNFVVSVLFASYALGVLFSLGLMTLVSDKIPDRRISVVSGCLLILASSLVMASAENPVMLIVGRSLSGLATGLLMGGASAAILELHPRRDARVAAIISTVSFTLGTALGPLFSGYLLYMDWWPMQLSYLPIALLALLSIPSILFTPLPNEYNHNLDDQKPETDENKASPSHRTSFLIAAAILIHGWSIGSIIIAVGPQYATQLVQIQNPLWAGALITCFQIAAAAGQIIAGKLEPRKTLFTGVILAATAQACIAITALLQLPTLHSVSCGLAGIGYGIAIVGATSTINNLPAKSGKARILSAYYMMGYIFGNALPALAVGAIIDTFSLTSSVWIFSLWVISISLIIVFMLIRIRPLQQPGSC